MKKQDQDLILSDLIHDIRITPQQPCPIQQEGGPSSPGGQEAVNVYVANRPDTMMHMACTSTFIPYITVRC